MFKMDYYVPKITISGQKMIVKVTEKWYKKIFLKFLHAKPFFGPTDLKFVYSEKATKFCEIFTLLLTALMYSVL